MLEPSLPVLGAAMPASLLADYREWLLADQRDVEIQDPCLPDGLDGDWRAIARRARDVLDGHTGRRGIHGPFDGIVLVSKDRAVRALAQERLCQGLEFAAEVGATHMVIHSPFKFFGTPFVPHSPALARAEHIALAHETLEPVLATAREIDCVLVIEAIEDKHPEPLLDLVRSFESTHIRMSLDVGHAMITSRVGGPPPDQWVREAGELLGHVHLQDGDGHVDRHWRPGIGSVGWYALFEALAELPRQPRLILELRNRGEIREGARWLAARGLAR